MLLGLCVMCYVLRCAVGVVVVVCCDLTVRCNSNIQKMCLSTDTCVHKLLPQKGIFKFTRNDWPSLHSMLLRSLSRISCTRTALQVYLSVDHPSSLTGPCTLKEKWLLLLVKKFLLESLWKLLKYPKKLMVPDPPLTLCSIDLCPACTHYIYLQHSLFHNSHSHSLFLQYSLTFQHFWINTRSWCDCLYCYQWPRRHGSMGKRQKRCGVIMK